MGQALYRKYRSKSLAEIIGQEHITKTLEKALASGRISHAYLFTGPRGVGKTSIARILAHQINGFDYQQEDNHIDIIEIDAASNRGIDEIRDLREKVYMAPVAGTHKVYIIDEVHMLTTQAFNALLKTLEEPPAHVVFILATTEVHKLPETIVSRTQRYVFRPVEISKVVDHLAAIAKAEHIAIDDEALTLIAEHGGGSFRDSISLLDQASGRKTKIDRALAEELLGVPSQESITKLLAALSHGEVAEIVRLLEQLNVAGFQAGAIAKQLGRQLRASLVERKPELGEVEQLELLRKLIDVPASADPSKLLEICLLETAATIAPATSVTPVTPAKPVAPATPTKKQPAAPQTATPTDPVKKTKTVPDPKTEADTTAKANVPDTAASSTASPAQSFDPTLWSAILNALKSHYNTLYGVMRMAQPTFTGDTLKLTFKFAFHQKRMNEAKHRKIVGDIIQELTGKTITIECAYDKDAVPSQSATASAAVAAKPAVTGSAPSLTTISNIFGGGELLES